MPTSSCRTVHRRGYLDAGGGVFDRTIGKWKAESLGSPGLLGYLNRHRPKMVVSGHIHEAKGIVRLAYPESVAETLVVNCAQKPALVTLHKTGITAEFTNT